MYPQSFIQIGPMVDHKLWCPRSYGSHLKWTSSKLHLRLFCRNPTYSWPQQTLNEYFKGPDGDRKVPPRHPLQRLDKLGLLADEVLNSWFEFLPSKNSWIRKFYKNADRMGMYPFY